MSRLVAILPARFPGDLIDLLPVRDESATQAISTINTGPGIFEVLTGEEFGRSPAIGGGEGLVIREQERGRIKRSMLEKCCQYDVCSRSGKCSPL